MRKSLRKQGGRFLEIFALLPFIAQTFISPILALEEVLPDVQVDIPIDTSEDILEEGISTGPEDELWVVDGSSATTSNVVVLDEVYTAPQNTAVSLTFTKLPEESGHLTVTEITLTEEEIEATNALSNTAYDITTDMPDGTYEYDLTLPTTSDDINVVYAESRDDIVNDSTEVNENFSVKDGIVEIEGLDHFTIFLVTFEDPEDPSPVNPGYNDEWFDYGGEISQVASGTHGIVSSGGDYHAEITGGAFTRYGGYSSIFPEFGYDTRVDVYLDMSLSDGIDKRFDFSSAISNTTDGHRRDFIFSLGTDSTNPGQWLISASNNAPGWPGNPGRSPVSITETGWYTLEHQFRETSSGQLEVTMNIYKKGETTPLGTWVLSNPTDIIGVTVGGNRYGWFIDTSDFDFIAIDNTELDELPNPDTTKPTIQIISPDENSPHKGAFGIVVEAEDSDSGLAQFVVNIYKGDGTFLKPCVNENGGGASSYTVTCTIDTKDYTDGTYKIKTNVLDQAGNRSSTLTRSFIFDNSKPVVSVISPNDGDAFKNSVDISIQAEDSLSGISSASMHIYKVEETGKTLVTGCTSIPTVFDGNTWNATINNGGQCNLIEGTYEIAAWAYDGAGNPGWAQRVQFLLDTTRPNVQIINPNSNDTYQSTSFNVVVKGEDEFSGLDKVVVHIYDSNNQIVENCDVFHLDGIDTYTVNCPVNTSEHTDGKYLLKTNVYDMAGNMSQTLSRSFVIDTISPSVEITSHNDGDLVNGIISISGEIYDLNLSHYWFVVTNSSGNQVAGPGTVTNSGPSVTKTFNWNTSNVDDGVYTIKLEARDLANNKNPDESPLLSDPEAIGDSVDWVTVVVDNSEPNTTFTPDFSESIFNSPILITGESVDVNNVAGVNLYYRLVGTSTWTHLINLPNPTPSSNTYIWDYTWTPGNDGTYDIKASAYDSLGNTENSPVMEGVIYDTTDPTIGNISIFVDYVSQYINGWTGFSGRAEVIDTLSGVDKFTCEYTLNGTDWNAGSYNILTHDCTFYVGSLPDAEELYINVRMSDKAGNDNQGAEITRTADSQLPSVDVNIENDFYGPHTFSASTIKGTAIDTVSDISSVQLSLQRDSDGRYWRRGLLSSSYAWRTGSIPLNEASGTNNWTYKLISSNFNNGVEYTVTPYAWDEVHLIPTIGSSDSFTWDNEAPEVLSFEVLVNGQSSTWAKAGDTITVTATITDPLSGIKAVSTDFSYNSTYTSRPTPQNRPMVNIGGNIFQATYTIPSTWNEGDLYITVATRDNVENYDPNRDIAQTLVIDNTPPEEPTLIQPLNNSVVNGAVLSSEWSSISDADHYIYESYHNAGATNVRYHMEYSTNSKTAYNVANTQFWWRVKAVDAAGNESNWSNLWKVTVDNTDPVIEGHADMTLIEGEAFPTDTVALTEVNPDQVCAKAEDLTGTLGSSGEVCIDVDSSNYDGTLFSLADEIRKAIEDWQGDSFTTVDLDVLPAGQYEVSYYATDLAGNESDTQSFVVTIEDNVPVVSISTASREVTVGTAVVLSASVTGGNALFTYLWSGACSGTESTTTLNTDTAGTYNCTVKVTDDDGDTDEETITITVGEVQGASTTTTRTSSTTTSVTASTGTSSSSSSSNEDNEEDIEDTNKNEDVLGESDDESSTFKVSGTVFDDKNRDGEFDTNEKGIEGIEVKIYNRDGELEKTVTTDVDGYWEAYLSEGEYTAEVEGAEDQTFTVKDSNLTLNIALEEKFPWWWILIIGTALLVLVGFGVDRYKKTKKQF